MRTIVLIAPVLVLLVACVSESTPPTAIPTLTAQPTPTDVIQTSTPDSTSTPARVIPSPAATPVPTATPSPTATSTATPLPTPTPLPITLTLDCNNERFIEQIIELSEEQDTYILKLYSGAEEVERSYRVLRCKGEARFSQGGARHITYFFEIDRDGDQFIGYNVGEEVLAPTPTPSAPPQAGRPPLATPTTTPIPTRRPTPETIEPKLGGKLTVAINSFDTEIMDPHVAGKTVGLYVFNHSQDFLIGIESDNTLSNAWGWADSWEQIDGRTWDITMKQDIIDHDGVNITAEDCQWNMDRLSTDPAAGGGYNVFSGTMTNTYKETEILDTHKCRIHLTQDYAFMFNVLPPIGGSDGYFFPKHSWVDNGGTAEGWAAAGYGGTGFTDMKEHALGRFVRHERYDSYYGDEEYQFKFREMEVVLSAEDAPRLALVATGAADIAWTSWPYVDEIRAAGLEVDGPKAVDVVYLGIYQTFDTGHCTNKLNVRKAMNLAVDAEAIRAGIWPPGIVTPAITAFTSPQDESWNPTLTPYGYDLEEAKRLLVEEGCENFRFDAYGYDFAAGPEMADMTEAIVTYLVAAGVDARFTPIDWAANAQKMRNLRFGSADGPASGGAHWQLGGRNFADKIRVHGLCPPWGGSVCNLPDPQTWMSRYLEYASIMDRGRRVARAQEMSKELYDLYAGIPIAMRNWPWALDPRTICGDWKPIDGTLSHTMFNTLVPCETR